MRFSLTRHQSDNVVTLILVGEVDMGAAGALKSAIHDALYPPGRVAVVVDLARVMFLDCAGIGALVAAATRPSVRDAATRWSTRNARYAGFWSSPASSPPSSATRCQHP